MSTPNAGHRARLRLEEYSRNHPELWDYVEAIRESALAKSWPASTFLPFDVAAPLLLRWMTDHDVVPPDTAALAGSVIGEFVAMATWRMTQGIYRIDPDLLGPLFGTSLDGDLPAHLLETMPEWCVYIETPVISGVSALYGVWCWLNFDTKNPGEPRKLFLGFDTDSPRFIITHVSLVGCLDSAARSVIAKMEHESEETRGEFLHEYTRIVSGILSVLLYICSQASEISGRGRPGNPVPVRTRRRGVRLFAADGPRTWDVGVRMGSALRAAYAQHREATERASALGERLPPEPHVRKCHWHSFVLGPRSVELHKRPRRTEWMPPIPVNFHDPDELRAVVRSVR